MGQILPLLARVWRCHQRNKFSAQKHKHVSHFLPISKFQKKLCPRYSMSLMLAKHHIIFSSIKSSWWATNVSFVANRSRWALLAPSSLPDCEAHCSTQAVISFSSHSRYLHALKSQLLATPALPCAPTSSCASTWPCAVETKFVHPPDVTFLLHPPPTKLASSRKVILKLF